MTSPNRPVRLLDPATYVDPFADYAWLRDEAPTYWDAEHRIWGVSRHEDVVAVERNAARYTSSAGSRPKTDQRDDKSMINQDDPHHQRQRMLVARQFTPRAVRQIEDEIRAVVTGLIDAVADKGACDAVQALAAPLPATMIGRRLGFGPEYLDKCREWSEITMYHAGQHNPADGSNLQADVSTAAVLEFAGATMELIADRRANPQDDLLSIWCHKDIDGEKMTDGDIISEALLLLDGGAETTRTVIGAIILELARRPDQRQLLLDGADMTVAVEEFIRWVTPILNMRRTATEDHEFHGQSVREGDEVLLLYGSANRDPRAFDSPDRLDVTRQHNHHVAFGFGTHFCLGASLARIELRVMFEELLRRIPDWRLAEGADPQIVPAVFTRGYASVPITFTAGG